MDRPHRKGPDYLARLGAAKHRVFADHKLSPKAVDAIAVLTAMCDVDVDVRRALMLDDRLHLCGMLARVPSPWRTTRRPPPRKPPSAKPYVCSPGRPDSGVRTLAPWGHLAPCRSATVPLTCGFEYR